MNIILSACYDAISECVLDALQGVQVDFRALDSTWATLREFPGTGELMAAMALWAFHGDREHALKVAEALP